MRKIAMITPWPNQRTGIADYAYDLTLSLAEAGVEVDVFTNCVKRAPAPGNVSVRWLDSFDGPSGYDSVVYQMGNCSDFHGEQIPVLAAHPGVVHLHDPTLHHLAAFFLYRDDAEDYYRVLRYWYGTEVADRVRWHNSQEQPGFWDSSDVMDVPFFDPIIQMATACIVHSKYARRLINRRFNRLPVATLPQVYRDMDTLPAAPQANETLDVGVFGIVQAHKHVDVVMQAVQACNKRSSKVHLHVCGAVEDGCEELPEFAESLGLADDVTFHGRLEEPFFFDQLKSVDVCITLRYPTMGETSSIVSRALQLGIPNIVSDVGWYAELPSCVKKIPVSMPAMRSRLTEELRQVSHDANKMEQWRSDCHEHAVRWCSIDQTTRQYIRVLDQFRDTMGGNNWTPTQRLAG